MTTHPTTVSIPRTWIASFMEEPIVEDAAGAAADDPDPLLPATDSLVRALSAPVSETKRLARVSLTVEQIRTLHTHAEWYAYYWGEEMAGQSFDSGERLGWIARGRSSRTLATQVAEILSV